MTFLAIEDVGLGIALESYSIQLIFNLLFYFSSKLFATSVAIITTLEKLDLNIGHSLNNMYCGRYIVGNTKYQVFHRKQHDECIAPVIV